MTYRFYIEQTTIIDDDHCETETIESHEGLSFIDALRKLEEFVLQHPDGDLNNYGGYDIDYETEDSSLDAVIEMEEC